MSSPIVSPAPQALPAAPRHARRGSRPRRWGLPGLACLLALGGCALIDQTTFAPAPGARPAAPATTALAVTPPPLDTRVPLLTIGAATAPDDYRPLLRFAVSAAQRRDRDVRFDVMAVAPEPAAGAAGAPALRASLATATAVMREIAAAGVPTDRIRLHAGLAPDAPRGEVRVYVR